MELILLRHGKAEDHGHLQGDGARQLVPKGREQAQRVAIFLRDVGLLPHLVLTSPLVRARQTAEIFCEVAGLPGPVVQAWLACGMHPDAALRELAGFSEFQRICLVGHEPDFSTLIAWLTHGEGGAVEVRKGGVAVLSLQPPSRHALLRLLIAPQWLPRISGSLLNHESED